MWDWKEIVGQTFCILATLLTFLSYQMNRKQTVLIAQTVATACMCAGYFFLGATSGVAMNIVCIARNLTFSFMNATKKTTLIVASGFAVLMGALGALSWQGWESLLIIVPLMVNTIFLSLGNLQLLRKSILGTSSAFFMYNFVVFSIGGMANELVAITSSIIGLWRFRKSRVEQKATENSPSKGSVEILHWNTNLTSDSRVKLS